MEHHRRHRTSACVALTLLTCGCAIGFREPRLHEVTSPPSAAEARSELKVHLKSGELLVLRAWKVAAGEDRLTGEGQAYTVAREKEGQPRRHDVPLAEVVLLETSSPESVTSLGLGLVATTTFVLGGITGYCAINPKGCFGSCPTFYVEDAGGREPERPQAEGFSESIARALEARDLDALLVDRPGGTDVAIVMRNEALETHAVRRVRLLAAPRPPGGRVLAGADDRLYPRLGARAAARVPGARGRLPGRAERHRRHGPDLARRRLGPRGARGDRAPVPGCARPERHRDRRAADPPLDLPLLPDDGLHRSRGGGVPGGARARGTRGGTASARHGAGPRRDRRGGGRGGRPVAGDRELRRGRADRGRPPGPAVRGIGRPAPSRAAAARAGALAPRRGRARGSRAAGCADPAGARLRRARRPP